MIRINNVSLPLDYEDSALEKYAAKELKISPDLIISAELFKRSIDARKKNQIHFEATIDVVLKKNQDSVLRKCSKAIQKEP